MIGACGPYNLGGSTTMSLGAGDAWAQDGAAVARCGWGTAAVGEGTGLRRRGDLERGSGGGGGNDD